MSRVTKAPTGRKKAVRKAQAPAAPTRKRRPSPSLPADEPEGRLVEKITPRGLTRALTRPPAGVTVTEGIDISHHNGSLVWPKVAAAGYRYVFVKATEGVTVVDKRFATNWVDARAAGMIRGAYHYFRPRSSPIEQADHFFQVVGALDGGDLPPVLDLEERTGWSGPPASRVQAVMQFLQRAAEKFRRRPIVYTSRSFMSEFMGASTALGEHALWVVDYGQNPPRMPAGWTDWTLWQHSEQGVVPGVTGPVDLDWFRGDLLAFQAFITRSLVPQQP